MLSHNAELNPRILEHSPEKAIGSTPCPDCGEAMVYRCAYDQEYGYWDYELDRTLSACACYHTLNVELWEGERVIDEL